MCSGVHWSRGDGLTLLEFTLLSWLSEFPKLLQVPSCLNHHCCVKLPITLHKLDDVGMWAFHLPVCWPGRTGDLHKGRAGNWMSLRFLDLVAMVVAPLNNERRR